MSAIVCFHEMHEVCSWIMEPKLEIRHLKLLAAVAEAGSVTQAGKRLHLTQSALSHQLRDAEQRVGAPLFLRLGKKMVPTQAGEKLLVCAQRILQELHSAERQIESEADGRCGVIRLSTECYTCYHWLPPLLKRFHEEFPKVELNISPEMTIGVIATLLEGKLDVAIASARPRDKKLRAIPIFEDEMILVMAPQHRLAKVTHIRPSDLEGETILCLAPREESTLLIEVMQPAGIEPARYMEIPMTEGFVELAAAGAGVGLLAGWAAAPHIRAGKIVGKPVGSRGLRRQWCAVTLRSQAHPLYLQSFLELFRSFAPF